MTKTKLELSGITRRRDLTACKEALSSLDGVSGVRIDYSNSSAEIIYDESAITVAEMLSVISEAGFKENKHKAKKSSGGVKFSAAVGAKIASAPKKAAGPISLALVFLVSIILILMRGLGTFGVNIALMESAPSAYAALELLLFIPCIFAARELYKDGFKSFVALRPDLKSLAAVSSGLAAAYSVVSCLLVSVGVSSHLEYIYFDTASAIIAFSLLFTYLEDKSRGKTGEPIKKLRELFPKTTTVILDDVEAQTDIENIRAGDLVLIKPGESFPCDGFIEAGKASVDEAMFTGENIPVDKGVGDNVYAGCVNTGGFATVRVQRIGQDTSLSRMIRSVESISDSKPKRENITKKAENIYARAAIAISLAAFVIWLIASKNIDLSLRVLISMLAVLCPCAMGLSLPCAAINACAKGNKEGVLFKNAEALENACALNTIVMDKTGTVTVGKPFVTDVEPFGSYADEVVMLAASLEEHSAHPIAGAILDFAVKNDIMPVECTDFKSNIVGLSAVIEDSTITVGKPEKLFVGELEGYMSLCASYKDSGKEVVAVLKDGVPLGIIACADKLKPSSASAVKRLNEMGLRTIMLTGDTEEAAKKIASELEFYDYASNVSPDKKAEAVTKLKYDSRKVAMVGDSINDAVALAAADIGVAIGTGSAVAIESAQIVLVRNDLRDMSKAIILSRETVKTVRENLFWSTVFGGVMALFAAGLSYLITKTPLSPEFAILASVISSVAVLLNSARLKRLDFSSINISQNNDTENSEVDVNV